MRSDWRYAVGEGSNQFGAPHRAGDGEAPGRILTTEEIYALVAELRVAGFNPSAKRDRNLVNRGLSDLAGRTTQGHIRPSPQLIMRVSRGRYLYREPTRPMDVALLQEYLEPVEAYEKRPARRRGDGNRRQNVLESVRMALYSVQRGVCPGAVSTSRII